MTIGTRSVQQSAAYARHCFDDYMRQGRLRPADLEGLRVLEIGPGDSLGVALLFAAHGAERVVAADRFTYPWFAAHQRRAYLTIRDSLSGRARDAFDRAVDLSDAVTLNSEVVEVRSGVPAQTLDEHFDKGSFDLVLSRAVIQEVLDIDRLFSAVDAVLRPAGRYVHKVDMRDYRMFSQHGLHPLTYLTIPEGLYGLMGDYPGRLNRKSIADYRSLARQRHHALDVEVAAVISFANGGEGRELSATTPFLREGVDYSAADAESLEQIRPGLIESHRDLPASDLLAASIFLVGQTPA